MVQYRLGLFDPEDLQPYSRLSPKDVASPQHTQLAYEAAVQSITLLKNDKTLPLSKKIKTVAVVGPNANATLTMQGNYWGVACFVHSPVEGIKKFATPTFVQGCSIADSDASGIEAAAEAAKVADATVVVVGIDQTIEAESRDRTDISLPGVQNALIAAVCEVAKGPCVVVYMIGGQVDMTPAATNPKVGAIVWAGYPGQSGGDALADVLFGDYNPGGRLPYTVYRSDYVWSLSMFDMSMRPNPPDNPGRSYRFFNGSVAFPFGYGLSYTNFSYSISASQPVVLLPQQPQPQHVMDVTITVTNTGKLAGNDVVIAYLVPPTPGQDGQPLKFVVGFERVFLRPGESRTIEFPVSSRDLALLDINGKPQLACGLWHASAQPPAPQISQVLAPFKVALAN